MGIYGAINSATSGLSAQATALENISGNVANSQTTGYKRLDTTFADLVSGGGATQASQVAGTTFATSRATNTIQGDISDSAVDTYMAINGDGYFVVTSAADVVDGQTTFADDSYYTRAGDFEIDEDGYMVNRSGYYLMGYQLDPATGNPIGDATGVIQIDDQPIPAKKTTSIDYQANLPPVPATTRYDGADPASALLDPAIVTADIPNTQTDIFRESSISAGSKTVYNENGTGLNVDVRWAKTANADPAALPTAIEDTWSMYVSSGGAGTDDWLQVGSATFDGAGDLSGLTAGSVGTVSVSGDGFDVASLTVGNTTLTGLNLDFGTDLTQFSANSSIASSVALSQDGYAAGEIVGISIDESGRINASYSNSQSRALYEIPLAEFDAEQELRRVNGSAFAATPTSGEATLTASGAVLANSLELSNADIADEFSKLIITQQAYSANSKIITSADEMLDSALNMVR
ncbi:flagellar hook protein FlgE [Roseibium algae]|uniref:Flagellar hook protein FlgE n=1 Tax=Roseibium algae TaxID=3123038 RepID=A0ABU8TL08_9HYPH